MTTANPTQDLLSALRTAVEAEGPGRGEVLFYEPVRKRPDFKDADSLEEAKRLDAEHTRALKRDTFWRCTTQIATGRGCGAMNRVGDTEFIQTHWYVEPYSCTGGDYYKQGEVQVVCPECGKKNRLIKHERLADYKPYGLKVSKEYDK